MRGWTLLAGLLLWLGSAQAQTPSTAAERAAQAFKKPAPAPALGQVLTLPVWLDGEELGSVSTRLSGPSPSLSGSDLLPLLEPLLRQDSWAQRPQAAWLQAQDLQRWGVALHYQADQLQWQLQVPMDLRRSTTISAWERAWSMQQTQGPVYRPEPWSWIGNLRTWHSQSSSNLDPQPSQSQVLTLEHALQVQSQNGPWVFEHTANRRQNNETQPRWNHSLLRLLHDQPQAQRRWIVGDVSTDAQGGIGALGLQRGLRVGSQWSLDRSRNVMALASQSLSLPEGAQVSVDVNGQSSQFYRLRPGQYQLTDIPLANGTNDVQVQVQEPNGALRTYQLRYFFDAQLLKPGLTDWAFTMGQTTPNAGLVGPASGAGTVAVGHLRHGWRSNLTLGVAAQTAQGHTGGEVVQTQAVWANGWGTWSGWWAHSQRTWGAAQAVGALWQGQRAGRLGPVQSMSWSVQTIHRQAGHAGLDVTTAPGASQEWSARLYAQLPAGWNGAIYTRQLLPATGARQNQWGLSGFKPLTKQWRVELGAQNLPSTSAKGAGGAWVTASLRYMHRPADPSGTTWQSQAQLAGGGTQALQSRLDWEGQGYRSSEDHDAYWQARIRQLNQGSQSQTQLSGQWTAPRWALQAAHADSLTPLGGATPGLLHSQYSEITLASALVLTRSGLQVSAPVRDSVVVFDPAPGYQKLNLQVDPQQAVPAGRQDRWGWPVLGQVNSYQPRPIMIDITDMPPGRQIGESLVTVIPTHRSVVRVPVGDVASTPIRARLLQASGQALALSAVRVVRTDAPGQTELFTNRDGVLVSPPLPPGQYRLERLDPPEVLHSWRIGPDDSGVRDLGTLQSRPPQE